jgi:hypothetical protein
VLVRLDMIDATELEELIAEAWCNRAPAKLVQAYLAERA